ncbi:MAG: heavy metal translocating P-type ATPase [Ruminococcus sp.]|nr:heavy metal translocating P-type ATPase [Ruminococcus sp.]
MRYTKAFDSRGRIRVRVGQYDLTPGKALFLRQLLEKNDYIISAKVSHISGSILVMCKAGSEQKVYKLLDEIKIRSLRECEPTPLMIADERFKANIEKKLISRTLVKLIVPFPLRRLFIILRAMKYVAKGLDCLIEMKTKVELLDAASIGISVARGNFTTASSVMFLLSLSELLEDYTKERARLALTEQLSLNISKVWLANSEPEVQVAFDEIKVGDKVKVYAGNVIPFDGTVVSGEGMVNQSTMTGESEPVHKKDGDSVFAGTAIEAGSIVISVRSLSEDSRLAKIISLINDNEQAKSLTQSRAERIADSIVPYSFLGFGLIYALTGNITKALSVLMVDFSCALKLSTPVSVISAMREAAQRGAAVKGGKYLESFAAADTLVFDKTGTLTNACPEVIEVVAFGKFEKSYVLSTAACLEEHFPHSVAAAVVRKAEQEGLTHEEQHAEVEYLVAHGIVTHYFGKRAVIGSAHFIFEDEGVPLSDENKRIIDEKSEGLSAIFLAIGGELAGMLTIEDPIREESCEVLKKLRALGIKRICMLTGDAEPSAKRVADQLGLDMYLSQVLPEHKSEYVHALRSNGHKVIMVGDGINDTPALTEADVSVAMSDGSDLAREAADITLSGDSLEGLVMLRKLSMALMDRINSNFNFIALFNASLIGLGAAGIMPPSMSAILHNGSTMLISANSMSRLLKTDESQ